LWYYLYTHPDAFCYPYWNADADTVYNTYENADSYDSSVKPSIS
jgi:hypothetical protein